jgi:hypothetical protein
MAVAFVAAGTVAQSSNPTVAVPAGYAAGDTLIIVTVSTVTTTTPTGWTLLSAQGSGNFITIFYKTATASESSVTLTNASVATAVMIAYRGVGSLTPVATYSTATSSTAITTNTLTTPLANSYVLSIYACSSSAAAITWTAPASTTAEVISNPPRGTGISGLLIVDESQATAGTSTARTATLLSSVTTLSAVAISLNVPNFLTLSGVTISGVCLG